MKSFFFALFALLMATASIAQIAPNSIRLPISPDPATGFTRQAFHQSFVILPDLEMIQEVRVVTMHPSGVPMRQFIEQDTSMTANQKAKALQRYADQTVTKSTAGAYIDVRTGAIVPEPQPRVIWMQDTTRLDKPYVLGRDPNWKPDPSVVPQKTYFQGISLGDLKAKGIPITDKTTVAQLIYILLQQEIGNIDKRGDL